MDNTEKHDTTPPEGPLTEPMLPEDLPPIAKGKAAITVAGAIMEVLNAVARLEAVAMAAARALDESVVQS